MISIKQYEELISEINGITENPLKDSYLKVHYIQKLIRGFHRKHKVIQIPSIKEIVANAYGLTPEALNTVTKTDAIKNARQMAMWFYYHYTNSSLKMIGVEFSDGTHSYSHCLVLFSVGKIDDLCSVDKTIRKERELITKDIEVYYTKVERKKVERIITLET